MLIKMFFGLVYLVLRIEMKYLTKPCKDNRRQLNGSSDFKDDPNYVFVVDLVARTYVKLPSEVVQLDFDDLYICVYCLIQRSKRFNQILKKQSRGKNAMLFPIINLSDLTDMI